jgi:REP element-mobilizing transposase RayT
MTNHVHLLIKMQTTPLDEIFQTVHMNYAKYFNAKRETSGHVFQGRPGMKMVLDDSYLEQLIGYIHRNPVKADMVEGVTNYEWSS